MNIFKLAIFMVAFILLATVGFTNSVANILLIPMFGYFLFWIIPRYILPVGIAIKYPITGIAYILFKQRDAR